MKHIDRLELKKYRKNKLNIKDLLEWIVSQCKDNTKSGNPNIRSRVVKSKIYEIEFSGIGANNILSWLYRDVSNEIILDRKFYKFMEYKKSASNLIFNRRIT